jgi:hypothetical protein
MWYLAEILFAEQPSNGRVDYQCESCNVLLNADNAAEAYRRAVDWGLAYVTEPADAMRLLGVSHLTTVGEELGDGTDICSRLFREPDVWARLDELIPVPGELAAMRWAAAENMPLGALLRPDQIAQLGRLWGVDKEGSE